MEGEQIVYQGTGAQINSYGVWGDYSAMRLDYADGCTFWHVNEYCRMTGMFMFQTRLASIRFDRCQQMRKRRRAAIQAVCRGSAYQPCYAVRAW